MKYKRETHQPTSSKSKTSKYLKLKKLLKEEGLSSLDAMSILDSSLVSKAEHRNRRMDGGSGKNHERQLNGKKYKKGRIEKRKKVKRSRRNKETSPKNSQIFNGNRKYSSSSSSKKKKSSGRHRKLKKEKKPQDVIRKVLERRQNESGKNCIDSKSVRKKYSDSSSSCSNTPEYSSSKGSRKRHRYSNMLADYLINYLSSNSLDSSSTESDDSVDENNVKSSVDPEVQPDPEPILVESDTADEAPQLPTETNKTTPTSPPLTETSAPVNNNDSCSRKEKKEKRRSHKSNTNSPTISHSNQSNERVNEYSDGDSSEITNESDYRSESSTDLDSDDSNSYVSRRETKRKLRPPRVRRKPNSANINPGRSNERIKSKQNALKFVVTDVEPNENYNNNENEVPSPARRNSPAIPSNNSSPRAIVVYNNGLHRNGESYDEEEYYSNLSEEDNFSDYKNDQKHSSEDEMLISNGNSKKVTDLGQLTIAFNSDDENAQILEINVPVPNNDYQSGDPHKLVIESEEVIGYDDAEDDIADGYHDNCRSPPELVNQFPMKEVESTADMNLLTIADIIQRMSAQEINATIEINEATDINESMENESVMPTEIILNSTPVAEEQGIMMVDDLPSDSSSIEMNDDVQSLCTESNLNQSIEDDLSDVQSQGTTPAFYNSLNSRQVLMLLKTKTYFHGALHITLLGGHANIFGYELEPHRTVVTFSPRGHSFLYISPTLCNHQNDIGCNQNLEFILKDLCDTFLSSDILQILSNFNSSTDAIVLLERDSTNKGMFMIEKFMKQTIFPNVNTFNPRRTYYHTETILHCQFMQRSGNGLTINPQWEQIVMTSTSRQIMIGGKGVGKSTFVRYMINKNLTEFGKILLIDLDIGQPELFLPQTVSATIITEPILGPGYLSNKPPCKSYLFGDVNVVVSPIKYLKCVLKLLKYCWSSAELTRMPWVINTMGYNRGFGLELMVAILRALNPTDLIQIQARRTVDNFEKILNIEEVNDYCLNIFKDEVQHMQNDCSYSTYICNTMAKGERKNVWDISPRDLRIAMVFSKLGYILQGNANWITDVRPVCASLNDLKILVVSDDFVNPHLQPHVINGNLVYLCRNTNDDSADEEIVECYGIGIVRAVEVATSKVFLLPSIPSTELQPVNVLAICSIPLPTSIVINQSLRITGRVPYVYSSDNFVGSRQIVPISYRPEKRMSNNNVKLV